MTTARAKAPAPLRLGSPLQIATSRLSVISLTPLVMQLSIAARTDKSVDDAVEALARFADTRRDEGVRDFSIIEALEGALEHRSIFEQMKGGGEFLTCADNFLKFKFHYNEVSRRLQSAVSLVGSGLPITVIEPLLQLRDKYFLAPSRTAAEELIACLKTLPFAHMHILLKGKQQLFRELLAQEIAGAEDALLVNYLIFDE